MVHGHGLLTWYSETTVSSNADHPPSVWQLLSVLKSERRSFVLNSINTDEHYGGYNLLLNTDFSLNDTSREWFSCGAIVHCLESFVSRGSTSHGDSSLSVQFKVARLDFWGLIPPNFEH